MPDDDRRPKKHPRRRRLVVSRPSSSSSYFSRPAAAAAVADDDLRPKKHPRRDLVVSPLPFDIVLHHILVFLPAISLLRFRSVCKSWLSAIADPRFIASHSVKSPPLLLFRTGRRGDLYLYDYRSGNHKTIAIKDLLPVEESIHLVHVTPSVNGLVLLYSTKHIHTRDAYTRIHICNPCTRQIVTLPRLDVDLGKLDVDLDRVPWVKKLIYCCNAETLWFGADPSTGKYKVVHFMAAKGLTTTTTSSTSSLCHVFTQGGDCWRKVSPSPPFVCLEKYPVSLKGVLYGTANTWPGPPNGMILSFDLTKEKLASIPPPPNLNGVGAGFNIMHGLRTIIVLQERLSVVDCTNDKTMAIWMLKDQQNNNNITGGGGGKYEWSKVYSFDIPVPRVGSNQAMVKRVIPTREGNFLLGTNSYTFLSFDPNTKSLSNLLTPETLYEYWLNTSFPSRGCLSIESFAVTTPYTETLAPAG